MRGSLHRAAARVLVAVAAAGLGSAAAASAGPIAEDTFLELGFTDVGVPATGCDPADPGGAFCTPSAGAPTVFLDAPPWTFTAPALGAELTVVDAFLSGDRFEVFDAGVCPGTTSRASAGSDCGDDPTVCLLDPAMSQGVFLLGTGGHTITVVPVASEGGGAAYLPWAAVPEPGSSSHPRAGSCRFRRPIVEERSRPVLRPGEGARVDQPMRVIVPASSAAVSRLRFR